MSQRPAAPMRRVPRAAIVSVVALTLSTACSSDDTVDRPDTAPPNSTAGPTTAFAGSSPTTATTTTEPCPHTFDVGPVVHDFPQSLSSLVGREF